MQQFIDKIIKTLEANGFPQKKVSLPTDKLFQMAEDKGISFNQVLEKLRTQGIEGEIGAEKTIFKSANSAKPSPEDLRKRAEEMMAQMTPEQREEMMRYYQSMSEEEKAQMMAEAKKMGLF